MKKITWSPLGFLTLILIGGFIILQSSSRTSTPGKPKQTDCSKRSMAKCTPLPETAVPGDMLMESVSKQFLMIR